MKIIFFKDVSSLLMIILCVVAISVSPSRIAAQAQKGAITEKEVKAYFIDWYTHDCTKEMDCYVTFDSPVKIAAPTRHSFQIPATTYTCYPVKVDFTNHSVGGTYQLTHHTHGIYYFYRNSFGGWEMGKEDERTTQEKDEQHKTTQQIDPKRHEERPLTKTAVSEKVDDPYPKPDFSELEKLYEVVKYEYNKAQGYLYVFLKQKTPNVPFSNWFFQFRDKDGLLITTGNPYGNGIGGLDPKPVGELIKAWCGMPSEQKMGKITSVKAVSVKE